MLCEKCGEQNPDDAALCVKCGAALQAASSVPPPRARMSRTAIASFVVAVLGVAWFGCLFSSAALVLVPYGIVVGGGLGILIFFVLAIPWIAAIVLGRIAKEAIRSSSGQLRGALFANAAVVLGVGSMGLAILGAIAESNMHLPEASVRGKVSHVRSDMRSLSIAIEAYYVDQNIYPAWGMGNKGPGGTQTYNYWIALREYPRGRPSHWYFERRTFGHFYWYSLVRDDSGDAADLPGFAMNGPAPQQRFYTLTTPLGYITSYPADFFSNVRGSTFVYWSVFPGQPDLSGKIGTDSSFGGVGWILVSPGPDLKYDIAGEWDVYNPMISQPSYRLLSGTNKKGRALTYDPTNGIISDGDIWRVKQ